MVIISPCAKLNSALSAYRPSSTSSRRAMPVKSTPAPPPRRLMRPLKMWVVISPIFLGPMTLNTTLPTLKSITTSTVQR